MAAELRKVAHDLIFKAVLKKTPVAGMPHTIPVTIFAIHKPNTSFVSLCLVPVFLSAILADTIVSRIATILITSADLAMKSRCEAGRVMVDQNRVRSAMVKESDGKRSHKVTMGCAASYVLRYRPRRIHNMVTGKIPGIDCMRLDRTLKNRNQQAKTMNAGSETNERCEKTEIVFSNTVPSSHRSYNPNAFTNCVAVMMSQTPIIKPCRAVDGISVIYLTSFNQKKMSV